MLGSGAWHLVLDGINNLRLEWFVAGFGIVLLAIILDRVSVALPAWTGPQHLTS